MNWEKQIKEIARLFRHAKKLETENKELKDKLLEQRVMIAKVIQQNDILAKELEELSNGN